MRILLIAPDHPDLPSVSNEVAAIASYHEVEKLVGAVRETDIQRAVQEGPYDVLWIASHGGPEGILLSSGVLSPEGIGQYVSSSGVGLCVLNTCASEEVAYKIVAGGDADMVFTITEQVKDEDALRFGSLFAGELSKSDDFEEAFKVAAGPGATKYRYLDAKRALRGLALQSATAMDKLETTVEALSRTVYESGVNTKSTNEKFENIRVQFEGMRSQFDTNRSQFDSQRAQLESVRAQLQSMTDRQAHGSAANGTYSPTFWALLFVIAAITGYFLFMVGRGL